MEQGERVFLPKEGMKVLAGVCPTGGGAPVVGRLIVREEGCALPSRGAFLSVFRRLPPAVVDCAGQMGVILVGVSEVPDAWQCQISCPILLLPALPEACLGRIGLLDPTLATVFVSPDLPTVGRYTAYWHRERAANLGEETGMTDGRRLRWTREQGTLTAEEAEWLVDCRCSSWQRTDVEETCYERFCELAECATGTPVAVILPFSRDDTDRGGLRAMARALFRAAVYGSFSVLVSGCLTATDVRSAREALHRAFCELEEEGRECNAYIPKGLLVDRPALFFSHAFEGMDWICLSPEALFCGLAGRCSLAEGEADEVWQVVEALLLERAGRKEDPRTCAIVQASAPSDALCRLLWRCGMEDCFASSLALVETKRRLRAIIGAYGEGFEKNFEEKKKKF